eukprot:CAMPEP_0117427840 /NCGR_PEP_ID=MMETSP0758-20121206/7633_1 /TAXON_ID=63605 /ORGANISM="Percolomonas cosmopolitus, Strain AE-1 (ATCC 50343)" /LENGTH=229 /DNA_ID=CAMNT_0005213769 /DNA_START=11 /DNA_END=700 /DNA_ORIENTATION=+
MKKVSIESKNSAGPVPGLLFNEGQKVGLIVLQEYWGVLPQLELLAEEFAKKGNLTTLIVDLYRGKSTYDANEALHLMTNLDFSGTALDIDGAVEYLKNVSGCQSVAATGFCFGGAMVLAAASISKSLDAAIPFYGVPPMDKFNLENIKCKVQCHFGKLDASKGFSDPEMQDKLEAVLKKGSVNYEFFKYDAGHAFMHHDKNGPNYKAYHEESSTLATKRMLDLCGSLVE